MKQMICTVAGVVGGTISMWLGGWDLVLQTLVGLMAADYLTGLLVAGVFRNSGKTHSGTLSSKVGFTGLCKKGVMLALVLVGARLDRFLGVGFFRDAVAVGFMANELLSILENAGRMGVPVPEALRQAVELLHSPEDKDKK